MLKLFSSVVVLLFFSGCSIYQNWRARSDFKTLCQVTKEFPWDKYSDPATAAMEYSQIVSSKVSGVEPFAKTMEAIAQADPVLKYQLIKDSAAYVGLENYECPALKLVYQGQFDQIPKLGK